MSVSWVGTAVFAILVGLVLQTPMFMSITVVIAIFSLSRVCNRYEFSIASLLIGTTVFGAMGTYMGVPGLGKLLGVTSVYLLKDTFYSLRYSRDVIAVLVVSICICCFYYFLGPKTPVTKAKLFEVTYYSIIYLIAFNALLRLTTTVKFHRLALVILWFISIYIFVVTVFELKVTGINILQIAGIRIAREQVNMFMLSIGNINTGGSPVSYQLVGNTATIAFILLSVHFFSGCKPKLTLSWLLVFFLASIFIVISGSRQSIVLLIISLASFLLIKKGVAKKQIYVFLLLLITLTFGMLIVGLANDIPSITALFETGKGVSSIINRDTNFNAAIELISNNPWMGVGFGGFYIPEFGYAPGQFRFFPHNVILELWSEMGLIGMVSFLSGWFYLYVIKIRTQKGKTVFDIYLPGGHSLLPLIVFYLSSALMNEILVKSMAMFILSALYISMAKKQNDQIYTCS